MWFKILQFVQFVLSLILEAENAYPPGSGDEKKASVMKSAAAELRKQGVLGAEGERAGDATLETVSGVVDGVVSLLHNTNAFTHAPKPEPAADPAAAPEAPAES